jgi:hypothetical protein
VILNGGWFVVFRKMRDYGIGIGIGIEYWYLGVRVLDTELRGGCYVHWSKESVEEVSHRSELRKCPGSSRSRASRQRLYEVLY